MSLLSFVTSSKPALNSVSACLPSSIRSSLVKALKDFDKLLIFSPTSFDF